MMKPCIDLYNTTNALRTIALSVYPAGLIICSASMNSAGSPLTTIAHRQRNGDKKGGATQLKARWRILHWRMKYSRDMMMESAFLNPLK